ncbi:MAG: ABC transporter ATP-binding protein [Bdellovibrionia bacterium]
MDNVNILLEAKNVIKTYQQGVSSVEVLRGIGLTVKEGEAVAILGSSGAGKSTLLQILGTLDRPTSGEVLFSGQSLFEKSEEDLALFRNQEMGFVFQFHHLLSELTALENVMLPCRIAQLPISEAERKARYLLDLLGVGHRASHFPAELSGGEMQRVAIARALVRRPKILFADEPTGNLDSQNSLNIQDLFFDLKEKLGLTLVVVTHDLQFAARFPRVLRMKDGLWAS